MLQKWLLFIIFGTMLHMQELRSEGFRPSNSWTKNSVVCAKRLRV